MWPDVLYAVWFFLPAGSANLMPILVAKLPVARGWDAPLDAGRRYRGHRLLGSSKTWRGVISGVLAAALTFWLQQKLAPHLGGFSDYLQKVQFADLSVWLGVLLGAGALLGDSVESFFKRQLDVPPGRSWFPFDQLDYIAGACLLAAPAVTLSLKMYLLILLVWFLLHLIFSYFGYLLRFKRTPI